MKVFNKIAYLSLTLLVFACGSESTSNSYNHESVTIKEQKASTNLESNSSLELNSELPPFEFRDWVNNETSLLIKKKEIAEYNYSLKYLPIDYLITNEIKKEKLTQKERDSLYEGYSGMEYFELKISVDHFNDELAKYNLNSIPQYQTRIAYMAFTMQNDLYMEFSNHKKVNCKLFHFERTYGVAPYAKFLMGFSKEDIGDLKNDYTVVFNDNLFNTGLIKFNWDSFTLDNIPQIKLS